MPTINDIAITKRNIIQIAAAASFGWFIPKYLVILVYEAIRNF